MPTNFVDNLKIPLFDFLLVSKNGSPDLSINKQQIIPIVIPFKI